MRTEGEVHAPGGGLAGWRVWRLRGAGKIAHLDGNRWGGTHKFRGGRRPACDFARFHASSRFSPSSVGPGAQRLGDTGSAPPTSMAASYRTHPRAGLKNRTGMSAETMALPAGRGCGGSCSARGVPPLVTEEQKRPAPTRHPNAFLFQSPPALATTWVPTKTGPILRNEFNVVPGPTRTATLSIAPR
ncbi:hypothetical protein VUR80DRAFT_2989 [Thermomyces stellatus]